jgi:hypothetical protein
MTPRQRNIMKNGLSSMLDLSDDSFGSQRSLFSNYTWNSIKDHYSGVLELSLSLSLKFRRKNHRQHYDHIQYTETIKSY